MLNHTGNFIISEYDTRLQGWEIKDVPLGASTHYYNFSFDCWFNGVELYNTSQATGIKISFYSEYYVPPTNEWKRYKKFAKDYLLFPEKAQKHILFPTTPKVGVRVRVDIDNQSGAQFDLLMNLFQFSKLQILDTSILEEGDEW